MKNEAEIHDADYFTKYEKTKFEGLACKASNPNKYRKIYLRAAFQEI